MSPAERRLAALLATFAPGRARELAARLGSASARDVGQHAVRLAAAPRRERLAAVAAALAPEGSAARGAADASLERPRVAALLRDGPRVGPRTGVALPLARLLRDRGGR
jgi:hypothetical protein